MPNTGNRRLLSGRRSSAATGDFAAPNFIAIKSENARAISVGGNGTSSGSASYTNQQPFIMTGRLTTSGASVRVNNGTELSSSGNAGIANMRFLRVGSSCDGANVPPTASGFWGGYVAEVVFYNLDLSASLLDGLRNYLNEKWAVY